MAHLTTSTEYGLHSLLWLVGTDRPLSTRELADFQGLSPTFLAKIFPKLEKAGILRASEGVRGGYVIARKPEDISFLEVVDAIEGRKPLFDCQQIRGRCAVFGDNPPRWAMNGVCSVHAVMLRAEKAMRDTLNSQTLADLAQAVARKAPADFGDDVRNWMNGRIKSRLGKSRTDSPAPRQRRKAQPTR
jgi:Rrf2 family protein